jgi:hypothetical protein
MSGGRKGTAGDASTGRLVARAVVAVLAIAALVALRPDRWLGAVAVSPGPASPSAVAPGEPGATTGPEGPWRSLTVTPLAAGPVGPVGEVSVAAWPEGYLAVGPSADGTTTGPIQAWTSRDGRAWVPLPAETFGSDAGAGRAVAALGGLAVAVERPSQEVDVYRSLDGLAWARASGPRILMTDGGLAGSAEGLLGIAVGDPNRLAFSGDGATWQLGVPPGLNRSNVQAVVAFGDGFVAVGSQVVPVVDANGTTAADAAAREVAAAWWSNDGLTWSAASLSDSLLGSFGQLVAGAGGLVALSDGPGAPGSRIAWQSSDGRSWAVTDRTPLGVLGEGEGQGSVIGAFGGDGRRLLIVGRPDAGQPTGQPSTQPSDQPVEVWTSFDGANWERLQLMGDDAPLAVSGTDAFLVRDGVLFVGPSGSWFGAAGP